MSAFPPKKKDQHKGRYQLGIFIRAPGGQVLEWIADNGTEEEAKKLTEIIKADGNKLDRSASAEG